jgi:hypothetical protein
VNPLRWLVETNPVIRRLQRLPSDSAMRDRVHSARKLEAEADARSRNALAQEAIAIQHRRENQVSLIVGEALRSGYNGGSGRSRAT